MSNRYELPLGFLGYLGIDRITGCLATFTARLYHEGLQRSVVSTELTIVPRFQLGLGVHTERSERETTFMLQVPGVSLWVALPFALGRSSSWETDETRWEASVHSTDDDGLPDLVFNWCLGKNPHHWSSDAPQQWRDGCWNASRLLGGVKCRTERLGDVIVDAPLPEGPCKVHVELKRAVTYWKHLPVLQRRAPIATVIPLQPPVVPGKGSAEWNTDYDSLPEISCTARTAAEAAGAFVQRVLQYRERNGLGWMPPGAGVVLAVDQGPACER